MIQSFRSKALEQYWINGVRKGINPAFLSRINRQLQALDAATAPGQMNVSGWGFHPLKGNRSGDYAVSVNANWRLTFGWSGADAVDVDLEDYH
ncbi:type II toxin-antitoxin system RelE/ParE family toxin [Inquilinus sp. OTU3971]|uniref:type II toxin-antitoxin system RelE/ParE family toxin n=1 Tax=Inquilinus sp. OTU3971 TaxID=3043855 RepID=UPI00313CA176